MNPVKAAARSEIYREAAERVFIGNTGCYRGDCVYSCCALSHLTRKDDDNAEYESVRKPYADMFLDDADWWNNEDDFPEYRTGRVLALLFMAAIAADEEATARRVGKRSRSK